jgi:cobalt/nickel transport system permease protein
MKGGSLARVQKYIGRAMQTEQWSHKAGLLQSLDPRVKILGLLVLILPTAWTRNFQTFVIIFALSLLLARLSGIPLTALARRAWLPVLFFTGSIALPAPFLVPGTPVAHVPLLGWTLSEQGLRSAAFLLARAETAATLSALLILTTPWTHVLKGLRVLRVPVLFVVILSMSYRYILLLLQTAQELFEARESRMVGRIDGAQGRRISMATAGVLLGKTLHLSEEVYAAMRSRGYRGEVYLLENFHMRARDWAALSILGFACALLVRAG